MIVNAYAVLDGFISLLRFGLGIAVLALGVPALCRWLRADEPQATNSVEDRCYLLFTLAGVLLALNLLAWPLFYLLLHSYIPEWPGVMCIYGVTRIGTGSLGASQVLPPLVLALQAMKPAVVFVSGSWFVLYLINRRTTDAPLTGRVLCLLLLAGCLAIADAAAELAYLVIPKQEQFLSAGCCTETFDASQRSARWLPVAIANEMGSLHLAIVYVVANIFLILALGLFRQDSARPTSRRWLALLVIGSGVLLVVNGTFLIEVVAPRLNRLPDHHCPYDLVERAPESLAAVALFFGASLAVGWAGVAGWLGATPQTRPALANMLARLARFGQIGLLWSLLMIAFELFLAGSTGADPG